MLDISLGVVVHPPTVDASHVESFAGSRDAAVIVICIERRGIVGDVYVC